MQVTIIHYICYIYNNTCCTDVTLYSVYCYLCDQMGFINIVYTYIIITSSIGAVTARKITPYIYIIFGKDRRPGSIFKVHAWHWWQLVVLATGGAVFTLPGLMAEGWPLYKAIFNLLKVLIKAIFNLLAPLWNNNIPSCYLKSRDEVWFFRSRSNKNSSYGNKRGNQ